MNLELKPNSLRIILSGLFFNFIFLLITITLFFVIYLISNSILKYQIYTHELSKINNIFFSLYAILSLVILFLVFSSINLIGNALTTKYIINKNFITKKTTFFNEIIEDIPIKQITNIDYTISWFWDKIFKTGSIAIYTSGSITTDLNIYGINSVKEIYETIKNKIDDFRKDIVNENEKKLIKTIRPNVLVATITITLGSIMGFGFLLIYLLTPAIIFKYLDYIIIIFIILILKTIFFTILSYRKKQYNFYTDKLEYYDGFLTLHKVSVPIERITDINLKKSILNRIMGVSQILINTAGGGASEIHIKYVSNGEQIVSELKEILKENGRN